MQELLEYIQKLEDAREILRYCPNAHVKVPSADAIISELSRLKLYAEAEYDED